MLKPSECGLVVIDVQGKLAQIMHESEHLHKQLVSLTEGCKLFEIPIFWLEQLPQKLGGTSEELASSLRPRNPIHKDHFSAWQNNTFRSELSAHTIKHVFVCGIETHICVYQTARDLLDNSYQVHVVEDAVSSRTSQNKNAGLRMMREHGAWTTNVESLLFELQQRADHPRFAKLLPLIK